MSRSDVEHILRRARVYTGFRNALEHETDLALNSYALAPGERNALLSRDIDVLVEMGIDADLIAWWCILQAPEPIDRSATVTDQPARSYSGAIPPTAALS